MHIKMKRYIKSGVRADNSKYVFDYTLNLDTDIIDISKPQLYYSSSPTQKVYWFGYCFKSNVSSKERSKFIHYIKGLSDEKPSEMELNQFIELPLAQLDKIQNISSFDCFVYPLSGRSKLVSKIVQVAGTFMQRDIKRCSFELVKSAPTDLGFDWDMFESDYGDDLNRYNQMKSYVETELMPKLKSLDYFSLAQNVKPKYRKYITNFLSFSNADIEKLQKLQGSKILIIDDINTSGSTLIEILRILQKINTTCEIYVYTLIGPLTR